MIQGIILCIIKECNVTDGHCTEIFLGSRKWQQLMLIILFGKVEGVMFSQPNAKEKWNFHGVYSQ